MYLLTSLYVKFSLIFLLSRSCTFFLGAGIALHVSIGPTCDNGKVWQLCKDVCKTTTCTKNPDAKCVSPMGSCGTDACKPKFYDSMGKEVQCESANLFLWSGSVGEQSGCWANCLVTRRFWVQVPLCLLLSSPEFNSLTTLVNSQLVCLLPIRILNYVMFNLKYLCFVKCEV